MCRGRYTGRKRRRIPAHGPGRAQSERPRERLTKCGASALLTAELLAILLRVGVKGENVVNLGMWLLSQYGWLSGLAKASPAELEATKGVGPAKVTQIKAAFELGRRLLVAAPDERPQIRSPADAANLLMMEMSLLEQEHLKMLLLDTKNRVIEMPTVYIGSLNTSVICVGELFRYPLRASCAGMIVVHNHPSGDPTPSPVIWRKSQVAKAHDCCRASWTTDCRSSS